jgi:SAM-dependent methyltransferase
MKLSYEQSLFEPLKSMMSPVRWTFISTRHIEAVASGLEQGSRVLSVGCGTGACDVLLALRHSHLEFVATDIHDRFSWDSKPRNLTFRTLDIMNPDVGQDRFDLVYSVECLEHIEDDKTALDNMTGLLRSGGTLVIIVPFANEAERKSPELIKQELENHQHHRPGYNPNSFDGALLSPFEKVSFSNCYFREYGGFLRRLSDRLLPIEDLHTMTFLYYSAHIDIRESLVESRAEALGFKMIASNFQGERP